MNYLLQSNQCKLNSFDFTLRVDKCPKRMSGGGAGGTFGSDDDNPVIYIVIIVVGGGAMHISGRETRMKQ